jgi:hypothetical protein
VRSTRELRNDTSLECCSPHGLGADAERSFFVLVDDASLTVARIVFP